MPDESPAVPPNATGASPRPGLPIGRDERLDNESDDRPGRPLDERRERAVRQFSEFLTHTLRQIASIAFGVATTAILIGAATYATGLWAYHGSRRSAWVWLGAVICALPAAAGLMVWLLVRTTARRAPRLADDVRGLLRRSPDDVGTLLDHDSGQPIATSVRNLGALRSSLTSAHGSLPALSAAMRVATRLPGLVVLTVLGAFAVGALGTIILIGHLIG